MDRKDSIVRAALKEKMLKLNTQRLKLFYGILVRYWASQKVFISKQNFFNLWCELNYLCAMVDESFPDPYDDFELMKSFCQEHSYYFIDILSPEIIIDLFCEHLDDRLELLAKIVQKLHTEGLRASYECCNGALGINEDVDELAAQAEEHVKMFS